MRWIACLLPLLPIAGFGATILDPEGGAQASLLIPEHGSHSMTEPPPFASFQPTDSAPESGVGVQFLHLWRIQEIYSNADGSVQFVELFTTGSSETAFNGNTLQFRQITPSVLINSLNFTSNVASPTTNRTVLIGTANLGTLYGVTPDFVIRPTS
jgi:hypothetical protein